MDHHRSMPHPTRLVGVGLGGALALAGLIVLRSAPPAPDDGRGSAGWTPPRSAGPFRPDTAPTLWVDTLSSALSVQDAVQTEEGWVLLDGRAPAIHMRRSDGTVRSYGRRGDGPGEMDHPIHLEVAGGVAAAVDYQGKRVDFFDLATGESDRVDTGEPDCPLSLPKGLVARPDGSFLLLQACRHPGKGAWPRLVRVGRRQPAQTVRDGPRDPLRGPLDPFAVPVLGHHGDRLYAGRVQDRCIRPVQVEGAGGEATTGVCHPAVVGPPLPDSARMVFQELDRRARGFGAGIVIPERLPPWIGLEASGDRLVFRVPTAGGADVFDVLVGASPGEGTLHRVIPPADATVFFGADQLLVVRDLVGGTELRAVAFP